MSLIIHVIYQTVGDTFEQYLTVDDLNIMRQVCHTSRNTKKVHDMLQCWDILPRFMGGPDVLAKRFNTTTIFVAEVMMFLYKRKKMDFIYAHLGMFRATNNEQYMNAIKKRLKELCDDYDRFHSWSYSMDPYNIWPYQYGQKEHIYTLCLEYGFNYHGCLIGLDKLYRQW